MAEAKDSSKSGGRRSRRAKPREEMSRAEQAEADSGAPVAAGTQVSPASGEPRIVQDVEGRPVDIPLDPETGAPARAASSR